MLCEISEEEKDTYPMTSLTCGFSKNKMSKRKPRSGLTETGNKLVAARRNREGEDG